MPRIQVTEEEAALIEARRQRQAPIIAWNDALDRAIELVHHHDGIESLTAAIESEKKALPQ